MGVPPTAREGVEVGDLGGGNGGEVMLVAGESGGERADW